jgi:fumarate reductase subunit D
VKNKSWIKTFARSGYASRGVIYTIIGFFTFLAAFGSGEKKDSRGALTEILQQPFGYILLGILIVGLISYSLWRLFQSIADADHHGLTAKGIAVRLALLVSAATYASLAYYSLARLDLVPSRSGDAEETYIEQARGLIGERYVALILASVFVIIAGAHIYKAVTRRYADHLKASDKAMVWIHPIAMSGLIARGIIFLVIGILLFFQFSRATNDNQDDIPSLKDVLSYVEQMPYSSVLLAALGIGIMLFAGYSFAEAKWRRINLTKI